MARILVLASVLAGALAQTVTRGQYQYYIDLAFNKSDINPKDGQMTCSEFIYLVENVMDKACPGFEPNPPTCIAAADHCGAADANNNNVVTEDELIDYVTELANGEASDSTGSRYNSQYAEAMLELFISGLTNVDLNVDSLTEGIGDVNPCVEDAAASLDVAINVNVAIDALLPGERKIIKCYIEYALGKRDTDPATSAEPCVPDECTVVNFSPVVEETVSRHARRLQTSSSTTISAKFYYESQGDADSAADLAAVAFADPATATASLGGEVVLGGPVTAIKTIETEPVPGNYQIQVMVELRGLRGCGEGELGFRIART